MYGGTMKKVILASGNKHKFDEINAVVKEYGLELIPMSELGVGADDIEETGDTFEENALIKARAIMDKANNMVIADDSGIEVDVLDGRPGVYSARYAGEDATFDDNNKKLLMEMKDVPYDLRKAKFVTVLACLFPNGDEIVVRGEVNGFITYEPQGEKGFGYDPLFYVPSLKKTYAQLTQDEKNKISHRGIAISKLKKELDKKIR